MEIEYENFVLGKVEIKSKADYTVHWQEWFSSEVSEYYEANSRSKKIWLNSKLMPLIRRLTSFVPTNEKAIVLKSFEVWEAAGVAEKIKFNFECVVNNNISTGQFKKADISATFGDRQEELLTCIEEIKLNLYEVLVKGETYIKKASSVNIDSGNLTL